MSDQQLCNYQAIVSGDFEGLPIEQVESLWPFPALNLNLKQESTDPEFVAPWVQIGEEDYEQFLNGVPPILMDGKGFVTSEPYSTASDGADIYLAAIEVSKFFFAKLVTLQDYRRLLVTQLSFHCREICVES